MFEIICPYCFERFDDSKVHFRAENEMISKKEENPLPNEYSDIDAFKKKIQALNEKKDDEGVESLTPEEKNILKESEGIIKSYYEWEALSAHDDDVYKKWWEKYNGTTEYNPADERFGIDGYQRPVIMKKDADSFIKDSRGEGEGMVIGLKTAAGVTNRRVCPYCHNPLPEGYGKYPVKFIAVVGITKAGKTVYLSQLLRNMDIYAEKVGMSIDENSSSISNFIAANPVKANDPLPQSTPKDSLQQPLFYDISMDKGLGRLQNETLVMYDVSGESFEDKNIVDRFAPFVRHADGVMLLVPPSQLSIMEKLGITQDTEARPKKVLSVIKEKIQHGKEEEKISLPVAVCISQADRLMSDDCKELLGDALIDCLRTDIPGIKDPNKHYKKEFNASAYNPIGKGLDDFFTEHGDGLATYMEQQYDNYAWFAFSSLGCDTEKRPTGKTNEKTGEIIEEIVPKGPVNPKHIDDPLLWMFYRFGYIGTNDVVYSPGTPSVTCPNCGSSDIDFKNELKKEIISEAKSGIFGIGKKDAEVVIYDTECRNCHYKWERDD